MIEPRLGELGALAERAGVFTSYWSWRGEPCGARPEVVVAVLRALGHELDGPDDAGRAIAAHERRVWDEVVPPVAVAWDGVEVSLPVRVVADQDAPWQAELALESGETVRFGGRLFELGAQEHARVDGVERAARLLRLPVGALGYHRLELRLGERAHAVSIIAAPTCAPPAYPRSWGVFAPLYGLRSAPHPDRLASGIGDLGDLGRLARRVGELGARYVGTLPLLACFLDRPCDYSPYGPVSRLAWNELYLDVAAALGATTPATASALAAAASRAEALRARPLIDYREEYLLRRELLEPCARAAWADPRQRAALEAFAASPATPEMDAYAEFRASAELHQGGWMCWPAQQAAGDLAADRAARGWEDGRRFHLWAQYAMDRQLGELGRGGAAGLYLDLPVGVNKGGFDTWAFRDVFVLDASAGAPPDALFLGGQDWGLAPLHPQRLRATGLRYWIDVVRHHVRHARMLRVDHVMGLHRLYWIPAGVAATDGVYVRYDRDSLYAVLCLEAARAGCALVGEDLGTVPDDVRPAMSEHNLSRLYVGQFSLPANPGDALAPPPPDSVASLNTHDTPTFAGFWRGDDIGDRVDLGLITPDQAIDEHAARHRARHATLDHLAAQGLAPDWQGGDATAAAPIALRALTAALAQSEAHTLLITLEDLWLEPLPQNVPGTSTERPNWRRPLGTGSLSQALDLESEFGGTAQLPGKVWQLVRLARP